MDEVNMAGAAVPIGFFHRLTHVLPPGFSGLARHRIDQGYFLSQLNMMAVRLDDLDPAWVASMDPARQEAYRSLNELLHPPAHRPAPSEPPMALLYSARSRLLLFLTDAELRATIALTQAELAKVQDLPELAAEVVLPDLPALQARTPPASAPWQDPVLYHRAQYLVDRLHLLSQNVLDREGARRHSTWLVLLGLAALVLALSCLTQLFTIHIPAFHPFTWWIMLFGGFGASTSILQRLQKPQADDHSVAYLLRLNHGGLSLVMSILLGAVFALMLVLVLCSGLAAQVLNANLFGTAGNDMSQYWLLDFGNRAGLLRENSLLMLVAFASGFAERLVPNVLSRTERESSAGIKGRERKPAPRPSQGL
jgi:hypothetical protein